MNWCARQAKTQTDKWGANIESYNDALLGHGTRGHSLGTEIVEWPAVVAMVVPSDSIEHSFICCLFAVSIH